MPNFKYVAKDASGTPLSGTLDSASFNAALSTLRARDVIIVSLDEDKTVKSPGYARGGKAKLEDLVVFSRQLATMVDAGIPLVQGLDILHEQIEKASFKAVIKDVGSRIEAGDSLSEALSRHSSVFSPLFVNMVKAGETSGTLNEILDRLATFLEKESALIRKVKSALVYPGVVSGMAFLITLVLVLFVIPEFEKIFTSLGSELPKPTVVLISISNAVKKYFYLFAIFFAGVAMGFKWWIKTPSGRLTFDSFKLKMVIFGTLFTKVAISRFFRTLSTLVKSGVPILNCLEIVGKTAGNKVIEDAVNSVRDSVREGESIAEPLGKYSVFPPMVVRMISVGEQTGRLEDMLAKISDFYEDEVDAAVGVLTSMIEPLIIGFLGLVIGSIVICMFLPIFTVTEAIK